MCFHFHNDQNSTKAMINKRLQGIVIALVNHSNIKHNTIHSFLHTASWSGVSPMLSLVLISTFTQYDDCSNEVSEDF